MHLTGNKESGEKLKKDNIRDYATEAFRFYAACGKKTSGEIIEKVKAEIYTKSRKEYLRSGRGSADDATAYAVMAAEDAIKEMGAEISDIVAVEKTMWRLNTHQKKAVEIVYFTDADKSLEKNDISDRVHQAEIEIPASERSIYEWLAKARRIFAEERGLRHTKNKFSKVCSSRPQKSDIMISSNSEGA